MLILISPAKTLDLSPQTKTKIYTTPDFLRESRRLIKRLREFSPEQLAALMNISDKLAQENYTRYKKWKTPFSPENAKQSLLAFQGDVYVGLAAESFKAADFKFAQKHLRILSGLYGILRPLDLMQAYRLEMGAKLDTAGGSDLYEFWGDKINAAVSDALDEQGDRILINLASKEYFKSVRAGSLEARVITPDFREKKNGKYRMLSFFAKKARGMMASHVIRNRLKRAEDLKAFSDDGYRYNEGLSSGDRWVFTRDEQTQ